MRRISIFLSLGALLAVFLLPSVAHAAPTKTGSDPAEGAEMHDPPERVSVTFDLPLDPSGSDLAVVDECGRRIDAGDVEVLANEMSVSIAKKPSGTYQVQYKATPPAGATGSTMGNFEFTVHLGPSCGPTKTSGHDGHSGHDGEGEGGGGHPGHDGTGGGNENHANHGAGESSNHGTHTTSGHSTTGHGGTHTMASSHQHSSESGGAHSRHNKHGGGSNSDAGTDSPPPIAAPEVGGTQIAAVPGSSILIALGICMLLGAGGGYLVRKGIVL